MGLKKKLAMGVATGVLAVSMIGGGTYAYFNDVETSNNSFKAGTLDLTLNPQTIINVDKIKPGDWMNRPFELKNTGNLDISQVILSTDYNVIDAKGDNTEDFGKYIRVNFLWNVDKSGPGSQFNDVIYYTTLDQLKGTAPDAVQKLIWSNFGEASGLKAGTSDMLYVQFEFIDDGDQNQFQGDKLELTWKFDAKQTAGEAK